MIVPKIVFKKIVMSYAPANEFLRGVDIVMFDYIPS